MRVLIFGGNGFLGTALGSALNEGSIAYETVSRTSDASTYNFDISVRDSFGMLPNNAFDIVVNCATILPGGDYLAPDYLDTIYRTNIKGSQNICHWIATQTSVKKIINCSSLAVVGKPWPQPLTEEDVKPPYGRHVLYSASKLFQEQIFETFSQESKVPLVQIRFSALYGPQMAWNGVLCSFIDQARQEGRIKMKNATKVYADFLHVKNASDIILAAANSDVTGILNGASGVETSLAELAQYVNNHLDADLEVYNVEEDGIEPSRAVIDVRKLHSIINTEKFISLSDGVLALLSL